ncbi:MAG: CDP-alcohol phosphatidyltransferase family protein [Gammaproteobacteria bacterium]|nr:CDP-alcohol phosphatidyltransferase family protein [Gammaproteobacteria bacterium]
MTTAILVGESRVQIWSLTGRQRLERQLRALDGVALAVDSSTLPSTGRVLLVRADYVFEQRALKGLLNLDGLLLQEGIPVAAHVDAGLAPRALRAIESGVWQADDISTFGIDLLQPFERDLRKSELPLVAPVSPENRSEIEDQLYGASYKGITDFVTKWWWPRPAKLGVRWCASRGIPPNAVTAAGFVLMIATCWLFYEGHYALGLLLGWFMTYLDTVDGKLARVTSQSSRFGHFLDHGMDIVHPPFWYWLWGLSLVHYQPIADIDRPDLYLTILAAYVGGRIIEAAFHSLGDTSIFAWRPFDAYFRLFTARRNPCLVLLTASWVIGNPALGLWLVAGWTALSTTVMLARFVYAMRVRYVDGPLTSWLAEPDAASRHPRAYEEFSATRQAYA